MSGEFRSQHLRMKSRCRQSAVENRISCEMLLYNQDHRGRFGSMQLAAQSQPQMQPCLSSVPKRRDRGDRKNVQEIDPTDLDARGGDRSPPWRSTSLILLPRVLWSKTRGWPVEDDDGNNQQLRCLLGSIWSISRPGTGMHKLLTSASSQSPRTGPI